MSLEPTFDLCEAYGMVGFSSLVFIILSLGHSLPIGMVSSSSFVSEISLLRVCWGS
jgi:hypothetical protein